MLVVVVRASMDGPEIRRVTREGGKIIVHTEFPENSLPRPYGTGTYSAALIPFSKDAVVVRVIEMNTKGSQPALAE